MIRSPRKAAQKYRWASIALHGENRLIEPIAVSSMSNPKAIARKRVKSLENLCN
jgi:hypothetical protein